MLENAGQRQRPEAVVVVLGDGRVCDADRSVSRLDHLIEPHQPALESGRAGDDLEGRARLVGVGDRPVAARVRAEAAVLVRIEARRARHRQNLPAARVHQDHAAGPGIGLLDCGRELLLGGVLDAGVERDDKRRALLRRLAGKGLPFPVGGPPRVRQRDDLSGLPADRPIVGILEAGEPPVVGAHVAEHGRRDRALRVETPALGDQMDAGQGEATDPRGDGWLDLALEPHEAFSLIQAREQPGRGNPQQRGERVRRCLRVADLVGDRVDGGDLDGDGELAALPVEDRSAPPG